MSYMSTNFRFFHASNLFVLNLQIFLLAYGVIELEEVNVKARQ